MYNDIMEIAAHFNVGGKPVKIEPIYYGHINHTFFIAIENSDQSYILQKINTNIFKNPIELMENISGVCDFLKKKLLEVGGDPENETMTFINTLDGRLVYVDKDGTYWRLSKYIKGDTYQSISKPDIFYNAAYAFGRFQSLLRDYPAVTLHETIPNFHNTVNRFANFKASLNNCKNKERLKIASKECLFCESREPFSHIIVDLINSGDIPIRVTHNDTKLNNVIMDRKTGKGLCVVDLDTVMPGSILYDFGDAIRFGACTTAEDEPDISKVACDLELFREFTEGYIKGLDGALTDIEYEMLPEGAMMMTYECGMRFLADYLDGDIYFSTHYENQNLARARTQFALLRDMESKLPQMKSIVRECKKL